MASKKRPSKREGLPPEPPERKKKKFSDEDQEATAKAQLLDSALISLNEDQHKRLSRWMAKRFKQAKQSPERKIEIDRIRDCRRYYEEGVQRTEIPIPGAHDYRSQNAASLADGMKARVVGIFADDPILKVEGRNSIGVKNALNAQKYMDYIHDHRVRLADKGELTSSYLTVEGHCVWYAPYSYEMKLDQPAFDELKLYLNPNTQVKKWINMNDKIELSKSTIAGFHPVAPPQYKIEEKKVAEIVKDHPDLEVLSLEDHIRPANLQPGDPIPWQGKKEAFSLAQLQEWAKQGKIYKHALEEVKAYLKDPSRKREDDDESPAMDRKKKDIPADEVTADELDAVIVGWVIWGELLNPRTNQLERCTLIFHPGTELVLVEKSNIYYGGEQPFFHLRLIRVPWRFSGIGVMELSWQGERASNDLTNYTLDLTRVMSAMLYKYKDGRYSPGTNPYEFMKGVRVKAMSDFEFQVIPDRRPTDMNIATGIRANTERRVGIGDLQLGRESDVTGKQPPTARGIISILREGQVRISLLNYTLISEIVRFGEYEMRVFQQFVGEQEVIDVVGEDGKEVFPEGLSKRQILGSYRFIPNVGAQNLIRELDAELNLLLYDRMINNKLINADLVAFYNMTKDVLLSSGKKKLWLRDLKFYQQKIGGPGSISEDMTDSEKKLYEAFLNAGMSPDKAQERIAELRGEASPVSETVTGGETPPELLTGAESAE